MHTKILSHLIKTYGFGHTASSYRVREFGSSNSASSVQAEQSAKSGSLSWHSPNQHTIILYTDLSQIDDEFGGTHGTISTFLALVQKQVFIASASWNIAFQGQ